MCQKRSADLKRDLYTLKKTSKNWPLHISWGKEMCQERSIDVERDLLTSTKETYGHEKRPMDMKRDLWT